MSLINTKYWDGKFQNYKMVKTEWSVGQWRLQSETKMWHLPKVVKWRSCVTKWSSAKGRTAINAGRCAGWRKDATEKGPPAAGHHMVGQGPWAANSLKNIFRNGNKFIYRPRLPYTAGYEIPARSDECCTLSMRVGDRGLFLFVNRSTLYKYTNK